MLRNKSLVPAWLDDRRIPAKYLSYSEQLDSWLAILRASACLSCLYREAKRGLHSLLDGLPIETLPQSYPKQFYREYVLDRNAFTVRRFSSVQPVNRILKIVAIAHVSRKLGPYIPECTCSLFYNVRTLPKSRYSNRLGSSRRCTTLKCRSNERCNKRVVCSDCPAKTKVTCGHAEQRPLIIGLLRRYLNVASPREVTH
jgi:hypothetical protein